jgi:serine/threonine-protein kinase
MVGRYGEVMIMDWGNAFLYNPAPYRAYLEGVAEGLSLEEFEPQERGVVVGTPLYMSPEQTCSRRSSLRPSSDIFSLGIVLYEMITGAVPFTAETFPELAQRIRDENPTPLHEVCPEVPKRLSNICSTMLQKDPINRYGSFQEVLADIADYRNSGQAFSSRSYHPGEIIFKEGDDGEYAFTVLSGKVEISKKSDARDVVLAQLGKGETVGELSIISKIPRTATARAVEATTIRVMGRPEVEAELEKLSPWVGDMIAALCRRFVAQNDRIVNLDKLEI